MSAKDELNRQLKEVVEDFKGSLIPLTKTIETIKDTSNSLSAGIGALNKEVLGLSKDVGNLEGLVKSNKDLSNKVERLIEKDGTIYKLQGQIVHLEGLIGSPKTDVGLFEEMNNHFNELIGS